MFEGNRVIHSDGPTPTLKDLSIALSDLKSASSVINIVASEDFLYLGSHLPFNHRWFEFDVVNDAATDIALIESWDGDEWQKCVDVIDQTVVGGVSFGKSGYISWVPQKDEQVVGEDTNDEPTSSNQDKIEGLEGVIIYDLYWFRISWTNDFNPLTSLRLIGHKFSDNDDLEDYYPDLAKTSTMANFKTGKTTWLEQEFTAAEEVIRNLKASGVALSKDQILTPELFTTASLHKVAEIIYRAFGKDYQEDRRTARGDFKAAMEVEYANIDKNNNARLDPVEKILNQGTLSR